MEHLFLSEYRFLKHNYILRKQSWLKRIFYVAVGNRIPSVGKRALRIKLQLVDMSGHLPRQAYSSKSSQSSQNQRIRSFHYVWFRNLLSVGLRKKKTTHHMSPPLALRDPAAIMTMFSYLHCPLILDYRALGIWLM